MSKAPPNVVESLRKKLIEYEAQLKKKLDGLAA